MNLPGSEPHRPVRLLDAVMVISLLSIVTALVIEHRAQTHLTAQINTRAAAQTVEALNQQVVHLGQLIDEYPAPPEGLSLALYEADKQALEQRLSNFEKALDSHPSAESLLPLQVRVEQLEQQLATQHPASPPAVQHHRSAPAKREEPKAPFQIVGLEQRAEERFLLLRPLNAPNDDPARLQLLHPGEEAMGWRLERIEGHAALFRRDDDTLRLEIPAEASK